jgi:hypothetical protein
LLPCPFKLNKIKNIGANKILAPTKIYASTKLLASTKIYSSTKLLATTKICTSTKKYASTKLLASTKYTHRQNIGVNKILCRQKLGVDTKLAQTERWRRRRRISFLLGLAESAAADFSQTQLKISCFSLLMVLPSVHAVSKWGIASGCPAFMGGLSPVLYRLIVLSRHAENVQNFGADKISASA